MGRKLAFLARSLSARRRGTPFYGFAEQEETFGADPVSAQAVALARRGMFAPISVPSVAAPLKGLVGDS